MVACAFIEIKHRHASEEDLRRDAQQYAVFIATELNRSFAVQPLWNLLQTRPVLSKLHDPQRRSTSEGHPAGKHHAGSSVQRRHQSGEAHSFSEYRTDTVSVESHALVVRRW